MGPAARVERASESRRRLAHYAVIAAGIVLVAGAANIAAVVVLPIVAGLFLCAMLWPLRRWLSRWMPSWIAAMACCTLLIAVMLVVIGWASYASVSAAEQFRSSQEEYVEQYQGLRDWLTDVGLPSDVLPDLNQGAPVFGVPNDQQMLLGEDLRRSLAMLVTGGLRSAAGIAAALLLTIFLAFLALLEGDRWASWAREHVSSGLYGALEDFTEEVSSQTRWYFLGKTITGLISGVATWVWLMSMDVPMAVVWGVFTFFMNFIPNVGALISGAPPTLLAIVELGWGGGLVVGAGLFVIETLVGNLIDPYVHGRMMELSMFVVLASLIFWGWLWGIAGAVMAPVLTAVLIAAAHAFRGMPVPGRGKVRAPVDDSG